MLWGPLCYCDHRILLSDYYRSHPVSFPRRWRSDNILVTGTLTELVSDHLYSGNGGSRSSPAGFRPSAVLALSNLLAIGLRCP